MNCLHSVCIPGLNRGRRKAGVGGGWRKSIWNVRCGVRLNLFSQLAGARAAAAAAAKQREMHTDEGRHFGRVRKMNFVRFLIRLGGWRLAIRSTAGVGMGRGEAGLQQGSAGGQLAPSLPRDCPLGSTSQGLCGTKAAGRSSPQGVPGCVGSMTLPNIFPREHLSL